MDTDVTNLTHFQSNPSPERRKEHKTIFNQCIAMTHYDQRSPEKSTIIYFGMNAVTLKPVKLRHVTLAVMAHNAHNAETCL